MGQSNEIYHRKLGKLISEQGRFIGYVFLVLGVALVFFLSLISIPVLLFALVVLINEKGVKIDFKTGIYKEYKSYLGIETGQWRATPAFKFVSIFRAISKTRLEARSSLGVTYSDYIYKLKLVDPKSKEGVLVFSSPDKALALNDAKYLSEKFGLEIIDNSNPAVKTNTSERRR